MSFRKQAITVVIVGAGGIVLACGPLRSSSQASSVTTNSCPASPCQQYVQTDDVECVAGVCVIDSTRAPSTSDLVVVVSLPIDAYFAPGATLVIPYSSLTGESDASTPLAGPTTAKLPNTVSFEGNYVVQPSVAKDVGWDLGTGGQYTSLPFHATFRLQWPPSSTSPTDAQSFGLPVQPVEAVPVLDPGGLPGPGSGPETKFDVALPAGFPSAIYELTLAPDPPFDQAFGPVTVDIAVDSAFSFSGLNVGSYEVTDNDKPQLQISRQGGVFDGWTAYLRSTQTKRTVSNVAPLAGQASTVTFAVCQAPSISMGSATCSSDALAGNELVVAPPAGDPEPTGVFNLFDMLSPVIYPAIPPPVTVTGRVVDANGSDVDATLVFEATFVVADDFEFTTSVTVSGGSPYSVTLPPGQYQVDVRPVSPAFALNVVSAAVQQSEELDFVVGAPIGVTGAVQVADGRLLAAAEVDAIGVQCTSTATTASPACLPRSTVATTDASGLYTFELDPGTYTFRVRPADGSGLPWQVLSQPVVVDGANVPPVSKIIVPAPMAVGLNLEDPSGNPIANAVVRVFRLPAPSQVSGASSASTAIELGDAITATDGSYEMFVAPPTL